MKQKNEADWASPDPSGAGADQTHDTGPPPLSDADRRRLARDWTDANARGDNEARQRVEAEILGHVTPASTPNIERKAGHQSLAPVSKHPVSARTTSQQDQET
ncbi:MAG: hypothetical protein AAFV87_12455 [Pseudomonadota bacterium]